MKKEIMFEIALRLKNLRMELNYTQKELANKLNIKRTTYTNWEVGRVEISLLYLNKIATFYQVNLDYLLGLDTKKKSNYNQELNFKTLAKNLKVYLKENNLKIEAFAIDAKTTTSTIWAYLNNKEIIRTTYLYLICKNNNLTSDKLFERNSVFSKN